MPGQEAGLGAEGGGENERRARPARRASGECEPSRGHPSGTGLDETQILRAAVDELAVRAHRHADFPVAIVVRARLTHDGPAACRIGRFEQNRVSSADRPTSDQRHQRRCRRTHRRARGGPVLATAAREPIARSARERERDQADDDDALHPSSIRRRNMSGVYDRRVTWSQRQVSEPRKRFSAAR